MPPVGSGSFDVKGDVLPDGRIVAVTGLDVLVETAPGSRSFQVAGVLDGGALGGATDPSFLTVNPSGTRIAIGAGFAKPVVVFDTAALNPASPANLADGVGATRYHAIDHYDGAWYDDASLAITAGTFGEPARVDMFDLTSTSPAPVTIVDNIAGASAGITFDIHGRLYTGNGFASGAGSDTGHIKAFDFALWSNGVADFEAQGALIADVLSATSLRFDREGNLLVGGGDSIAGDMGYLGVIEHGALAGALAGLGAIDAGDPSQLLRLTPVDFGIPFFGTAYDPITGTLFATDGSTWYATIPTPGALGALAWAMAFATRRQR